MLPKLSYLEKYKSGSDQQKIITQGSNKNKHVKIIDEDVKATLALQSTSIKRSNEDVDTKNISVSSGIPNTLSSRTEMPSGKRRRYDSSDDESQVISAPNVVQRIEETVSVPSLDGQNAPTVFRDSYGFIKTDVASTESSLEEKKRAEEREKKELLQGRVQKEEEDLRAKELQKLSQAPFARSTGDVEMETFLKSKIRDGDPMANFLSQKADSASRGVEKKVYRGPMGQPNRFGISPGHRWDRVDRSNGFETKLLLTRAQWKAKQKQAYAANVADM